MRATMKTSDDLMQRLPGLQSCQPGRIAREEARESFIQEALASWRAFRETGMHLSGREARAWLDGWGTDDMKAAPGCHA